MATGLQPVDGVALKVVVVSGAAALAAQKEAAFNAASAVRQVEIGLSRMLSLLLGVTATVCGVALVVGRTYPQWLGGFAIAGGLPITAASVVMASMVFSGLAMAIYMPANSLLLLWMFTLGMFIWRRGGFPPEEQAV